MSEPRILGPDGRPFYSPSVPRPHAGETGYKGASLTRDSLRGWRLPSGSPDEIVARDLRELRRRASDLVRNGALAAGVEHTKAAGVVGTGLSLQAAIDREYLGLNDDEADAWEASAERLFAIWANSPESHAQRRLNFYEQQDVAFRRTLRAGDHWVQLATARGSSLPFALALQHIAAERVSNPNGESDRETLVQGVQKRTDGAPVRIHVSSRYPNAIRPGAANTWQPLDLYDQATNRRRVLHIARVLDPDETRPAPDLAPVIEEIKQLGRYTDAEINAAVLNAFQAMTVQSPTGMGMAGMGGDIGGWAAARREYYQTNPLAFEEGGSNILALFPDDNVQSFTPTRPNAAFEPFLMAGWSMIGIGLELPHEILTKRFQSSYSAARAALLVAWQFFIGRRVWLAANFCQPVYEAFVDEMVAFGRLRAPGYFADPFIRAAYLGSEWVGDAQGQIDESKAVDAAERRINLGISTLKRETMLLTGQDWEAVQRQREKERRKGAPAMQPAAAAPNPATVPGQSARLPIESAEALDRADTAELHA